MHFNFETIIISSLNILKMRIANSLVLLFLLIALSYSFNIMAMKDPFCWKGSYGRGFGSPLNTCSSGRDKIGLLCYTKCPIGFSRSGFDCHQNCPPNFRDDGLYCRLAEYGRGAGYPWKFGDPLNDSGMFKRCEADHGAGNCEKNGDIVYPKCKTGFYAFGCCICRPNPFNCSTYGFPDKGQLDISCAKRIIIGDPVPMGCDSDHQSQSGLCYPNCKSGYYGKGPVCWAHIPQRWVDCGLGAAVDGPTCKQIIINQIVSVGMLAAKISTFAAQGKLQVVNNQAQLPKSFVTDLTNQFIDLQKLYKQSQQFVDYINKAAQAPSTAQIAKDIIQLLLTPNPPIADIIRVTAEIVSLVDPIGISQVVIAFSYPVCSRIIQVQ